MAEKCFILMPFQEPFNDYYKQIIVPAVKAAGFVSIRADEIYGIRPIIDDIFKEIRDAATLVADVTGKNPNVNYELGIAHAFGRPVVIISQSIDDIPFDYRHLRAIIYDTTKPDWMSKLKDQISYTLQNVHPIETESEYDCEDLETREAMYFKACNLIKKAKKFVIDTTWGPDAPQLTQLENSARSEYTKARKEAVERGVSYKEIFTDTKGKRLQLKESASDSKKNPSYQVKKLKGFVTAKPVIDFMVVDYEYVILSHVRSERMQDNRFIFVKSKRLASFFIKWFEECWVVAKPVKFVSSLSY